MLAVPGRLGPYEIVAPLGAGGMGEVYRARDTRLGRAVALKVLPAPFANDPDRRARFEREARAVAALSHPNILAIHDYDTQGSVTYAVMELLEGETLRSRLAQGPLPWREAVEVAAAVADGLTAAHARGVIHRDLKPENLFLTTDRRVKILDFGLARLLPPPNPPADTASYVPADTDPGTVMGTAGYMSPEQVRGRPADARSDLFSFGCVLYEMVTGQRAFRRETAAETMTAILHDEPPDAALSGGLLPVEFGRLIRQCLAKDPGQRPQSAHDLTLALGAMASDPNLPSLAAPQRFPRPNVGVTATLLLVWAAAAAVFLFTRANRPPADQPPAAEAVAVLPFENIDGDPAAEPLSDGLADHLIDSLQQVRRHDLKVRPFASVARYKRQRPDVPTLGRELNVGVIVAGTLRQQGDELVVGVELIDARDDNRLWGTRYRRKREAILDLQEQLARDVADHLHLRLSGAEQQRLTKRRTASPEAYQLYLVGRYHWNKRTREGFRKGIECFEQAIDKDPTYALAYSGLADCYKGLHYYEYLPAREAGPRAAAAARRALEIDEDLAEAHKTLAAIKHEYDWDWPGAEREFKRALELSPDYATAHQWYGEYLSACGRHDEALAEVQRASELDPLSLAISTSRVISLSLARRHNEALGEAHKLIEAHGNSPVAHRFVGQCCLRAGRGADAVTHFEAARQREESPEVLAGLMRAYRASNRPAQARQMLERLQTLAKERFVSPYTLAQAHAGLGDHRQALDWLDRACAEKAPQVVYLRVDPTWDGLRTDPRFVALLDRVGPPR